MRRDGHGITAQSQSGRTIDVVMDSAFSAVVVYTGMPSLMRLAAPLAIEPMTCATDAFNHPDWGLKRLLPGESSPVPTPSGHAAVDPFQPVMTVCFLVQRTGSISRLSVTKAAWVR